MSELTDMIWTEKYRPKQFSDLILADKATVVKYMNNPKSMPSFIFYSNKPGTGKTSTAKIISLTLGCDCLAVNASDDRGIDTIREKIKLFARSLSSDNKIKRCIFLDEADGLTKIAQDSLRNLMEEYSENSFFVFSCNDLNKLIEPIRSRCVVINFERPNKTDIVARLNDICSLEQIDSKFSQDKIEQLVNTYYPDIRTMISKLQQAKTDGKPIDYDETEFEDFLNLIKKKEVEKIYEIVYSGSFKVMEFNKWFFDRLFKNYKAIGFEKSAKIAFRLADTEKYWNMGANIELVFLSNILEVMKEM